MLIALCYMMYVWNDTSLLCHISVIFYFFKDGMHNYFILRDLEIFHILSVCLSATKTKKSQGDSNEFSAISDPG